MPPDSEIWPSDVFSPLPRKIWRNLSITFCHFANGGSRTNRNHSSNFTLDPKRENELNFSRCGSVAPAGAGFPIWRALRLAGMDKTNQATVGKRIKSLEPKTENQTMKPIQPIYLLVVFLANAALSLLLCAVTLHFAHKYTDQATHSTNWHQQELQRQR